MGVFILAHHNKKLDKTIKFFIQMKSCRSRLHTNISKFYSPTKIFCNRCKTTNSGSSRCTYKKVVHIGDKVVHIRYCIFRMTCPTPINLVFSKSLKTWEHFEPMKQSLLWCLEKKWVVIYGHVIWLECLH